MLEKLFHIRYQLKPLEMVNGKSTNLFLKLAKILGQASQLLEQALERLIKIQEKFGNMSTNGNSLANYSEQIGYGTMILRPEWIALVKVVAER